MISVNEGRRFLKSDEWQVWRTLESDQRRGIPAPPPEKPCPEDAQLIDLVAPEDLTVGRAPLLDLLRRRRSRRAFTPEHLSLEELSFLLWATQGVSGAQAKLRTVPSGGGRHPFETYLLIRRVEGVEPGIYRYLPLEHKLCFLRPLAEPLPAMDAIGTGQRMMQESAVLFLWTALPYRTEWRHSLVAHKMIAQDSGHVCENLYLACEAIGAGACAIGGFLRAPADTLLGVDGEDEFVVYMAAVGKAR